MASIEEKRILAKRILAKRILEQRTSQPSGQEQEPKTAMGIAKDVGMDALNALGFAGRTIDRVTGAPVRSAIRSAQKGENPLTSYARQFGRDPSLAPTGKDIVQGTGIQFNDRQGKIDPVDILGFGMDVIADPSTLVAGAGMAAKLPGVKSVLSAVKGGVGKGSTKIASALTGVPQKEISTLSKRFPEVKKLLSDFGKTDKELEVAADEISKTINKSIQGARKSANKSISAAIDTAASSERIPIKSVVDKLQGGLSRFDDVLDADSIADVQEQIGLLSKISDDAGTVSLKQMNRARKTLDQAGRGGRLQQGKIFARGDDVSKLLIEASDEASSALKGASPEIRTAFQKLSELRKLEKAPGTRRLLLEGGQSIGSITSAGSGVSPLNRQAIEKIDELTGAGGDLIRQSENFAAARRFGDAPLVPVDVTGKSGTRLGIGTGVGGLLGGLVGGLPGAATGTAVGGTLTSPFALKTAIQSRELLGGLLSKLSNPKTIAALQSLRMGGLLTQ